VDKKVLVYIDLEGHAILVGRLWSRVRGKKESASFEYDQSWLERSDRFSLEPALALTAGSFHTETGYSIFGSIGDSAPDRWGRALMRRAERKRATDLKETPRTLFEIDFLLLVDDESRQGALRFKLESDGVFLAEKATRRIPPLIELPNLLSASQHISEERETAAELRLLLAPGSSLGGARPKSSVLDKDGSLCIAKFPNKEDEIDIVKWEAVSLALANKAGISVPKWRLEKLGKKSVLLLKRFDRKGKQNNQRIPFLSAMSMLGAKDNETRSYLELADAIKRYGSSPKKDLEELYRRIIFNILISNTDDHLRNHGFLYQGQNGWSLSPAYDLNPVPVDIKPRILSTNISEDDATASLALAFEVAPRFGLELKLAQKIAKQVSKAVSQWKFEANSLGLSKAAISRMASAFEETFS
jgi:serine/threonine-protein kinase HipA